MRRTTQFNQQCNGLHARSSYGLQASQKRKVTHYRKKSNQKANEGKPRKLQIVETGRCGYSNHTAMSRQFAISSLCLRLPSNWTSFCNRPPSVSMKPAIQICFQYATQYIVECIVPLLFATARCLCPLQFFSVYFHFLSIALSSPFIFFFNFIYFYYIYINIYIYICMYVCRCIHVHVHGHIRLY